MIPRLILAAALAMAATPALPHDIYSGVHGKTGQLCCGGDVDGVEGDCAPALARATSTGVDFYVRGREWVHVPTDLVTFLPVAGDENINRTPPPEGMIWGHFCARRATDYDRAHNADRLIGDWFFYCAFYNPGGV